MVRFLPFLISLALSVYALFSCIQTPDEDVPHLPKLAWIVLIVFVPFVGPIVWLLMSRTQGGGGGREAVVRPSRPVSRPLAPDDDPDFLKSLDRYRDPRTTIKPPPEPEDPADEDRPQDKPKKTSDDTPSETDDGNA
ncbi:PLD nuclease N-terminal domain-containing protein [Kribbella sp. NBC_00709]|uniref:PLD nuclease N-terminal domain-containing protein n=1 Tax=Kribbella sp. NBC_00709 TaxID=2975972 RepID=UPI002E2B7624|nr:PLD nuclease N-terminal domain-containing protein [Kribbella sp. NBC_00709]